MARRRRRKRRAQQTFVGTARTKIPRVIFDPSNEYAAIRVQREPWLRFNLARRAPHLCVYRPEVAIRCVRHQRQVVVRQSAAPGYLFLGAPSLEPVISVLRSITQWFDMHSEEPTILDVFGPIKPAALQFFSDHLTGFLGLDEPELPFLPEQRVIVDDGPMIGSPAIVQGMPDPHHVRANVLMFSRQVLATFSPTQLRAA